ncbi:MAG: dihydrofolate reductase family protein [Acidobacteria bacterium]|nr:dihydrofolate reductase family protein [Acidobacteriota bacterium]
MNVFLNYAMTVDGKISSVDRRGSNFSSSADKQRMDKIRARADVIVVGAETVRYDDPSFRIRDEALVRKRVADGRPTQPDLCVLTASGHLPPSLRIFRQSTQRLLIATPARYSYPPEAVAEADVLPVNSRMVVPELVRRLAERGYEQVLVEGGGRVNARFFQHRLVNEIYLTVSPVILGGASAPTPVDGAGMSETARPHLALLDMEQVGQELFLHYGVHWNGTAEPAGSFH